MACEIIRAMARFAVLVLLLFLSIITYLDRVAIAVAATAIQKDLNISVGDWGIVVSAFALAYALFEIPTGAMGDRIGPRRVLTRIVLWWSAFTALTGAMTNFWGLAITRFLFGVGEAGAFPNGAAAISRWFVGRERARATAVMWSGSRVGGALTPLLVGPIIAVLGWRESFFVFGLVGVVWAVIWYLYFRDDASERVSDTQYLEELRAAGTGRAHVPLPWHIALKKRNFWLILGMYHLYCLGSFFYVSWMPQYLEKGRGFEGTKNWLAVAAPFVVGIFGNLLGGTLSDWLNQRYGLKIARRSVGGIGLIVSGLLMLATSLTPSNIMAVVFLALGYGAMDCMLPVSWAVCQDVGRRYSGAVSGAMNMAGQLGSFILGLGFGKLVEFFGNYNTPLIPMAGALVLSGVVFFFIDPTEPLIGEDEVPAAVVGLGHAVHEN